MSEEERQFERERACYEQNCQSMRALTQVMWQVPTIAMTLTGGLWYGVTTLQDEGHYVFRVLLLLLAVVSDLAFIVVLLRVRAVTRAYLAKIKEFDPGSFPDTTYSGSFFAFLSDEIAAKGEDVVVRTFSCLLALAAIGSAVALILGL